VSIACNPTTGELVIDNLQSGDKVEVYNVQGVLVGTYASANTNIAHLPAGVYIVKAGNRTGKVVKE
jgi:hypothetical protein